MISDKTKSDFFFILIGISLSIIIYAINCIIFNDFYDTVKALILSLAYVPIAFIYQTFLVNRILEKREKFKSANKTNMIIGFFYLELGTDLISLILQGDTNCSAARKRVVSELMWENGDFDMLRRLLKEFSCNLDISKINLMSLQAKLDSKDNLIMDLIMNPIFDSDERFSNLLTALLRLRNLFQNRYYDGTIAENDKSSLSIELCNVYYGLLEEWVAYMEELQKYSPILYAKATIYSPFSNSTKDEKDDEYKKFLATLNNNF